MIRDLLSSAANRGTGSAAALRTSTFGKTGTTQDSRDAIFVGYAGGLVTAVWIGNDDNSPLPGGAAGGGVPARIWRNFMAGAINEPAEVAPEEQDSDLVNAIANVTVEAGLGNMSVGIAPPADRRARAAASRANSIDTAAAYRADTTGRRRRGTLRMIDAKLAVTACAYAEVGDSKGRRWHLPRRYCCWVRVNSAANSSSPPSGSDAR
jgi:membrane peptidoglycan carboxypeptidase